jgi:hypothetical protein
MWHRTRNFRPAGRYASAVVVFACAVSFLLAVADPPAHAQGVQTVLHARGRVFPDVGRGAAAIETDRAGHYYVLASPASVIAIYSADGKRIGQIPRDPSASGAIKYAVDFDRDATSGRIFVADRGANAVKIFTPEGALEASVPVNAPMSVVALAGGEFAVVTLRSDHLVRVMNEHGKLVRTFGNISDAVSDPSLLIVPPISVSADSAANSTGYLAGYPTAAPLEFAMDIGKLYSGAPGDIYFAFTSLKDPKFRKYDRFGYAGYEAEVSAKELVPDISHDNSQVQLGMRISGMAGPGEMFSFGSMYSVGGGAGFTMNGGNGGAGRRGGSAANPNNNGGAAPGGPGGTGGASSGNSDSDSTSSASGSGDSSGLTGSLSASNGSITSSSSGNFTDFSALLGPGGGFGAPGMFGPGAFPGLWPGGFGGPAGGYEHHTIAAADAGQALGAAGSGGAAPGPAGSGTPGGALNAGSLPGAHAGGPAGIGGVESPGAGHGEYGERYGHGFQREGLNSFSGVVKFTEREPNITSKPVIHALGVDRANQQVWAAIGDMLLRFDRDGNLMDTYRVATNEGASLQPVGILVEPDRILLLSDPAGIYEFARPDKPQLPGKQSLKLQPASP